MSGLQHFAFCRRQWALIRIEQQWAENLRTVESDLLHDRAHEEQLTESRGDILIVRGLWGRVESMLAEMRALYARGTPLKPNPARAVQPAL